MSVCVVQYTAASFAVSVCLCDRGPVWLAVAASSNTITKLSANTHVCTVQSCITTSADRQHYSVSAQLGTELKSQNGTNFHRGSNFKKTD